MGLKLGFRELQTRMRTYARDSYLFIYSAMKGASLANAAYALAIIWGGGPAFLIRLPFWLVSFAALILTYNATFRGILTAGFRFSWLDSFLPFTLAVIEFLLFSMLQQQDPSSPLWNHWYLVFALHSFSASALVWNRARQMEFDDFDDDIHSLIERFEVWLKRDKIGAVINGIVWTGVWVVMNFFVLPRYPSWQKWQCLLAIPALGVMIFVIYTTERDRISIVEYLMERDETKSISKN